MNEFFDFDIRMLEYQLERGPVSVQVVSPFREITWHASVADIVRRVEALEAREPSAIYTSLNFSTGAFWPTNASVPRRQRILIEADPARLAGLCATDAEVALGFGAIERTREYVFSRGVPRNGTALALSGNGSHFVLFVNWLCDARSDAAITGLLRGLSAKYSTPEAAIDTSVGDRRRITKMYGCMTRKKAAEGRPQRRCHVLEMPELAAIELIPLEVVERIVAELGSTLPVRSTGARPAVPGSIARKIRLIEEWAEEGIFPEIKFVKDPDSDGNVVVVLECCPRDETHTGTSAAVLLCADGGWQPLCRHDHCQRLSRKEWWAEVQERAGRKITFERMLLCR